MLPRKNRKNKVFRTALDLRATRASDGTGSKQCKRTAIKEKINRQANSVKSLLQMFEFWVDTVLWNFVFIFLATIVCI